MKSTSTPQPDPKMIYRLLLTTCLAALLLTGCAPTIKVWSALPQNAPGQIARMVDCRDDILLIPLITFEHTVILGDPLTTRYPYTDLPDQFTSYEYDMVPPSRDNGQTGRIVGFLLLGGDGTVYDVNVEDMPTEPDTDMIFYQAQISPDWQQQLSEKLLRPSWPPNHPLWVSADSVRQLSPVRWQWQDASQAIPTVKDFLACHPVKVNAAAGKWRRIVRPLGPPNVFCGRCTLPQFTAGQVLTIREEKRPGPYYSESYFMLSNHAEAVSPVDVGEIVTAAIKSGQYKVICFVQPPPQSRITEEFDPERDGYAPELRRLARELKIPLMIVSPAIPDPVAPLYPGIFAGLRQYWQCPECAR